MTSSDLGAMLAGLASRWCAQIAETTVRLLAAALAAGGGRMTIEAALSTVLADIERAKQIAITEITRLMSIAAERVYEAAGIIWVRWLTDEAAPTPPCPACLSNQEAGRWPLGVPFPSGAPWPPDHPGCRCAVVPVPD